LTLLIEDKCEQSRSEKSQEKSQIKAELVELKKVIKERADLEKKIVCEKQKDLIQFK
jgi:hypothetical protein